MSDSVNPGERLDSWSIERVQADRLPDVLRWVLGTDAACSVDDAVREHESGRLVLDGIWAATAGRVVEGGIVRSIGTDGVAQLWQPGGQTQAICDSLVEAAVSDSLASGAAFCQLLTTSRPRSTQSLAHYCDLQFLALDRPVDRPIVPRGSTDAASVTARGELQFAPVSADSRELEPLLAETFVDSTDAAELHTLQSTRQTIAGLLAAGDSGDRHWSVVRCDSEQIGLVLLARHERMLAWEIAYLGLIPSFRGVGLGHRLVSHAIGEFVEAGGGLLFLAVDSRNAAALHLYARAGFTIVEGKQVWIDQVAATAIRGG